MGAPTLFEQGTSLPPVVLAPLTAERVAAYALASGDTNPIHLDAEIARRAGFSAPLVHGMLLAALIGEAARRWAVEGRVVAQRTQFLAPVTVGEAVAVTARVVKSTVSEGARRAILRAMLTRDDGKPAAMAEIDIVLGPAVDGSAP